MTPRRFRADLRAFTPGPGFHVGCKGALTLWAYCKIANLAFEFSPRPAFAPGEELTAEKLNAVARWAGEGPSPNV